MTEASRSGAPPGLPRRSDLALALTLLDLLLKPIGRPLVRVAVVSLAAGALLLPALRGRAALWWILAALCALRIANFWPLSDNHAYLLVYWCLAAALALHGPAPGETLARSARGLIGLAFAFAVLWKGWLAPEFLDGRFFRATLLLDPRFEDWTRLTTGLSGESIEAARAYLKLEQGAGLYGAVPEALSSARLARVAAVMTGWTLAIEALLALAFLGPRDRGLSRLRDELLILFCATTYAVATVEGFGWLLIALGVAQARTPGRWRIPAYLGAYALILFHREVAWIGALADRLQG